MRRSTSPNRPAAHTIRTKNTSNQNDDDEKHPSPPTTDHTHKNTRERGGEFKTIEEYVEFVLTELLREDEPEQAYTPEEEEEIKERLRRLGYIQ